MEMSSADGLSWSQKCPFSNRKTNIFKSDPQECHPCLGKTICAESGPFVVVRLACVACIFFLPNLNEHHDFSPNASKRILSENPGFKMKNKFHVLVWDLSSKTESLEVIG